MDTRVYLTTKSDLCHLYHKLIGFYSRYEKYLLRGTDWVFKLSSLCFVCKGLMCFKLGHVSCYCNETDYWSYFSFVCRRWKLWHGRKCCVSDCYWKRTSMIFVHAVFKTVVINCNSNRWLIVGLNYSGKIHKYIYDTKMKYVS